LAIFLHTIKKPNDGANTQGFRVKRMKFYTRKKALIPHSRQVFDPDDPNKACLLANIEAQLVGFTPDKLKKALDIICAKSDQKYFRLLVFAISKALSNHGIAPRWQGLYAACLTAEQEQAIRQDAPLMDLYWLSLTFPKHKTLNRRWQGIFTNGFSMDLALSISERQLNTAKKVESHLDLSIYQQLGCIHFYRQGEVSVKTLLKKAKEKSNTALKREQKRSTYTPQITPEIAKERGLVFQCWLLSEKSATRAAVIYQWMTGNKKDRANIVRTIENMKLPVRRTHVDI